MRRNFKEEICKNIVAPPGLLESLSLTLTVLVVSLSSEITLCSSHFIEDVTF